MNSCCCWEKNAILTAMVSSCGAVGGPFMSCGPFPGGKSNTTMKGGRNSQKFSCLFSIAARKKSFQVSLFSSLVKIPTLHFSCHIWSANTIWRIFPSRIELLLLALDESGAQQARFRTKSIHYCIYLKLEEDPHATGNRMQILELLTNCHMFCLSFMSSSMQVSLLFNPYHVSKCVSGTHVCEHRRESSCQVFAIGFQGVWFQVRCLTLLILIMMCAIYTTCSLHHQWLLSFVAFTSSLCCSKDNYA